MDIENTYTVEITTVTDNKKHQFELTAASSFDACLDGIEILQNEHGYFDLDTGSDFLVKIVNVIKGV